MARTLRIVAISDTHTMHEKLDLPDGDVLVHGGDISIEGELVDIESFDRWLGTLPYQHKIVVCGNHDFCFQRKPDATRKMMRNAIYLEDAGVEVQGVRFWGSPWQPWFYDWAFNLPRGGHELEEKWSLIPPDTDVVITHGPPFGIGDRTFRGDHAGCEKLLARVRAIQPKVHVFGHIHEAYGLYRENGTTFVNASSCTIEYKPTNGAFVVEVEVPVSSPA